MTIINMPKYAAADEASCDMLKPYTSSPPLSPRIPRRQFLEAAGTVVAGATAALLDPCEASALDLTKYFSILATGEALFVTFYKNAVDHAGILGLHGEALNAIRAILTEEQIHYEFALKNGGMPATGKHFSFPHGKETFEDRGTFLATQQLAEELTNGALLAWINDFAKVGNNHLAQIGGQLMQVEGGHRVVGRVLLDAQPWDDWGFGPVAQQLTSFLDVPTVVGMHGFLSPKPGNDFVFQQVPATFPGVINTAP